MDDDRNHTIIWLFFSLGNNLCLELRILGHFHSTPEWKRHSWNTGYPTFWANCINSLRVLHSLTENQLQLTQPQQTSAQQQMGALDILKVTVMEKVIQCGVILIVFFSNRIISAHWRKWMSQTWTSQSQNGSCWGPNGKRCPASSHEEDECWTSVGQCSVGAKHHHHNSRWWWHLKYCLQITWKCGGFFAYKVFSLQKKVCEPNSEIIIKHCNFSQPILNWNDFGTISLYCTLFIYKGKIISSTFNIIKGNVTFKMFSEKWMVQQWKKVPGYITESMYHASLTRCTSFSNVLLFDCCQKIPIQEVTFALWWYRWDPLE